MTLRDALAAALYRRHVEVQSIGSATWEEDADALLSDPAFRAALTEAVAEALAGMAGWDTPTVLDVGEFGARQSSDTLAAAIAARMLGET